MTVPAGSRASGLDAAHPRLLGDGRPLWHAVRDGVCRHSHRPQGTPVPSAWVAEYRLDQHHFQLLG
ncbi:hypothetical protein D3C71_317910 [compost metagenome]